MLLAFSWKGAAFTRKLQKATSGEQSIPLSIKSKPRTAAPTLPLLVETKLFAKELCLLTCFPLSQSPGSVPRPIWHLPR